MKGFLSALTLSGLNAPWRQIGLGLAGSFVGMLIYVARISEAASYLSDDPRACINCHVMQPQYATWQHSSHAGVATCNDCHVPHDNEVAKLWFKAKDGLRHAAIFTFRAEKQVINAIPASKHVIQKNCIRCHGQILHTAVTPMHKDFERSCVDCHRETPHGRIHSLSSTPNASVPPLSPVLPEWMVRALGQPNGKE